MTLRKKVLGILLLFSFSTLGVFFFIVNSSFVQDKTSYVFDAGMMLSRTLVERIRGSIDRLQERHRANIEAFDSPQGFRHIGVREGKGLCTLAVVGASPVVGSMTDGCSAIPGVSEINPKRLTSFDAGSPGGDRRIDILEVRGRTEVVYGEPLGLSPATKFISLLPGTDFDDLLSRKNIYEHYLVGNGGKILFGPEGSQGRNVSDIFADGLIDSINAMGFKFGSLESKQAAHTVLISFAILEDPRLLVLSVARRSIVLHASVPLFIKTVIGFVLLGSLAILLAMLASRKLTSSIQNLSTAMRAFGEGKLDVSIDSSSDDEVGELASYFNIMTDQIRRAMRDGIVRARMEAEMETARRVQATLFPISEAVMENFTFAGYYEPASECGGDWWYYFKRDNSLFVCMGDVTGHGVPSALITSACRATMAQIESDGQMSPARVLEMMNRAVFETTRGELQMTFFAASLNAETGELRFANASHEEAVILPPIRDGHVIKRTDLKFLSGANGRRLGEDLSSVYIEKVMQLECGARLFVFSDGAFDVSNLAGEKWSERQLYQAVVNAANEAQSARGMMKSFMGRLTAHRQRGALNDDLSFFFVSFND